MQESKAEGWGEGGKAADFPCIPIGATNDRHIQTRKTGVAKILFVKPFFADGGNPFNQVFLM